MIKISSNRNKLLVLIILSASFSILSVLMIIYPDQFISTLFKRLDFIRIAGIIGAAFFSVSLMLLVKILLVGKTGIIIYDSGIEDNSNFASVGLVEWKDVTGIRRVKIKGVKFLAIDVIDNGKYLNKSRNKIQRSLLKANIKLHGTPICISSTTLNTNFNELESIINEYYTNFISK